MNAEVREIFRNALLLQLEQASTMGLAVRTLHLGAKLSGHASAEIDDVKRELDYLKDKGLAKEALKTISPENQRWLITAEGRDHLAMQGLA